MTPANDINDKVPAEAPPEPEGPPRGVATMSIVRWVLVGIAGIVAVASILSYAGVRSGGGKATSSTEQHLYTCPMHPAIIQDHPGECPICGMTLVLKTTATPRTGSAPDAGQVAGLSPIDLTPERIQLIGMKTAPVKREALGGELRTVGVVAANERGLAQITTRFAGWVQKLLVSETGERVRRGQALATIYSPDVLRAEQELLVAAGWNASPDGKPTHADLHGGDGLTAGLLANARRRLELLGISAQEIDDVLRTGKAVEAIAIRSPAEGYVVGKNAVAGVAVQPGTVLFEVADLSQVWVTADVYEQDISRIHVGQPARLELSSFPGESHAGKVKFIYPVLDANNRTLRVRLEFKNRSDRNGPRLRPGMYGTVYLNLPATTGLTVPAEAVVDTGEMHYVFVAANGGHFEPRLVKLGARATDRVEILSGVSEGETVVTTGNFLVDSESRLRAAIEGQTSGGAPAGGAAPVASTCNADFDAGKFPDKYRACRACEVQHRGMGTMEEDCKKAIPKPWK
ncbi:MAG TPA: efflux RND transporter periplasmic adaptor subunit [Polyangia bacterium]|jgi:Cu(I)/Ag(I) efflux system membrane fusion protein|nr:efflux RND transporter periplasmic adaptor subunit [Polyangia bacterium]